MPLARPASALPIPALLKSLREKSLVEVAVDDIPVLYTVDILYYLLKYRTLDLRYSLIICHISLVPP